MFKKILIGLILILAVLAVVIALRPAKFHYSRSITIAAAPDVVFPQVNVLKNWEGWNPWGKLDPQAKMTYEGPPAGVGASYSWSSTNNNVGEGKNTIIESEPGQIVAFRLEFKKPMEATNTAEFSFKPDGPGTIVTWSMSGHNNFIGKAFGLFVDCDKMIGTEFDKGLASMKAIVEGGKK